MTDIQAWSKLINHTGPVRAMTLLKSGDFASGGNEIIIWNVKTWEIRLRINGFKSYVSAMTILNNGDLVTGHYQSGLTV